MAEFDPWYHGPGSTGYTPPPPTPDAPPSHPDEIEYDHGYTPNYKDIIQHDPGYMAAMNAAEYGRASGAALRRQTLRDALIRYGGLPAGFKDAYGDLDEATQKLASGNQNSILSQLEKGYGQQKRGLRGNLAARGMLQSGELNYGDDQLTQGYAQQRYDAGNIFGDQAQGALRDYTGILGQNARDIAAALGQASSDARAYNKPRAARKAQYDSGYSQQWGRAIYKDSTTNVYYTQDGKVFTPGGNWWS